MKTQVQAPEVTLAPIVDALHLTYAELGAKVTALTHGTVSLPPVVFVVQRDKRAWGHITTRETWATPYQAPDEDYAYTPWALSMGLGTVTKYHGFYEIMVSAENLARGGRDVFGTVAHEVAHAINLVRNNGLVVDVDSNGRHNLKFKQTAEYFFGLTIEEYAKGHWAGWTKTTVGTECARTWATSISRIDEAIAVASGYDRETGRTATGGGFTFGGGSEGAKGRDKNGLKAVCSCGSIIRTSRKALDKGITCGECEAPFIYVG